MQTFNEYQEFVDNLKIYPKEHSITYPILGICGEAGECSEKIKKFLRGDRELDKVELVKELGDILFYICALASDLGYTLMDVVDMNEVKLTSRRERGILQGNGDNR